MLPLLTCLKCHYTFEKGTSWPWAVVFELNPSDVKNSEEQLMLTP